MSLILLLCRFAEVIYPAYASFKAISGHENEVQWLTYWIVYAMHSTIESALSLPAYVPLYMYLKFMFIVYLISPQTSGAKTIYDNIVLPFLNKNSPSIDPLYTSSVKALDSKTLAWVANIIEENGLVLGERIMRAAYLQVGLKRD